MKKLLKRLAKKSMALAMAVVMLMSCWVFFAPVPEAQAAAETLNYDLATLNSQYFTTSAINNAGATFVTPSFAGTAVSDSSRYAKLLASPNYTNDAWTGTMSATTSLLHDDSCDEKDLHVNYAWHVPSGTIVLVDGSGTNPKIPVIHSADPEGDGNIQISGAWPSNSNFALENLRWYGLRTDAGDFDYNIMHGDSGNGLAGSKTDNTGLTYARNNKAVQVAGVIIFQGAFGSTELVKSFKLGFTGWTSSPKDSTWNSSEIDIVAVNYGPLKAALTAAAKNVELAANDTTGQYTDASKEALRKIANQLVAAKPDNTYKNGTSWNTSAYQSDAQAAITAYNNWVNGGGLIKQYKITWVDHEDNVLDTHIVEAGKTPSYGSTPTREPDTRYTYEFAGWQPAIVPANADATYKVQWNQIERKYTVTFEYYDADGQKVTKSETLFNGDTVSAPNVPSRPGYKFTGWAPAFNATVSGNVNYVAQYGQTFTVTFQDHLGTVLKTQTVDKGASATAPTSVPYKDADADSEYKFIGWDKDFSNVQSDLVVTAKFEAVDHSKIVSITIANANCTSPAKLVVYCEECGYQWSTEENPMDDPTQPALGHTFDRENPTWTVQKTGPKDDNGHTVKCSAPGCTATTTKPHDYEPDTSKDPVTATCTIPGETYEKCTCGWTRTVVGTVDPTNHVNTTSEGYVAPQCGIPGFTGTVTCDACHTVVTAGEEIPALTHEFTKYVSDGNATCTADGTKTALCNHGCGEKNTVADPGSMIDHKYTTYVYNNDAKCEIDGTETAVCDYGCGKGVDTRTAVGTALEHDYTGEHKSNNDGTHEFLCKNGCGTYGGTVDCVYGAWVDVDANSHKHTCTTCGYTPAATAHVWGEWTTVGGSDSSAARQTRSCTLCGRTEEIDCTYTSSYTKADCENNAYTTYTCADCGHGYTVIHADTATGHKFDGAYNYDAANDKHQQACTNEACTAYGVGTTKNEWADCSWSYANAGAGKHTATCVCGNSEEQACSGGTATCTAQAVCQFCNTAYGATAPHSYTGTVIKLDGDKHAYLCEFCNDSSHYGVGAEKDATEACSGGSATCKDLAVCDKCNDTHGELAAHTFNGTAVKLDGDVHAYRCSVCNDGTIYGVGNEVNATEACSGGSATCTDKALCDKCSDTHGELAAHTFNGTAVKLDGDVHAYRCSVCKNDSLYGVGNEVNATEACSGGSATCTDKAVCDICKDTHGELDANAHKWGDWANIEGTLTHKRVCEYNNEHTEEQECFSSSPAVAAPDCNTEGYTLNTCDDCGHTWKTEFVAALGHDWGEWVSNGDLTHTRTCKRGCAYADNTQTEACTKEEATFVVTDPTCTAQGYTTYTCNDCAYTWNDDYVDALGHNYTEKIVDDAHFIAAANCEVAATYWYDCSRCDKNAKDETDAKYTDLTFYNGAIRAHSFVNKIDPKYLADEATCFAGAKYYTSCKYEDCGKSSEEVYGAGKGTKFSDPSSRLEHNWTKTETYSATDATCAKDATYYYECSICHSSSKDYDNGSTWTKENSKTGHKMTHKEYEAATCESAGNLEYWYCSVCKKYYKDAAGDAAFLGQSETIIKKLNHEYDYRPAKAPTCEEEGISAYSWCKHCNKAEPGYTDEVYPAKGHNFAGKWVYDEENLYHSKLCRNGCGKSGMGTEVYSAEIVDGVLKVTGGEKCTFTYTTETVNGVHKHNNTCVCGNGTVTTYEGKLIETVAPECTEDGYDKFACPDENCTDTWIGNVVKATGHTLDGEAKSNGDGTHSIKCSACGYQNNTEKCYGGTATCGSLAVCEVCYGTYGEKGICEYDETKWVVKEAEKCGVNRIEENACINCGTKITREVLGTALKHDMTGYVVTQLGTCTERSVLTNTCKREGCGFTETKHGEKDSSNHMKDGISGIDENVYETVGNCATGVTRIYTCKYCGGKKLESVSSAHIYKEYARVYGACEASGYITLKCDQCNQKVTIDETYPGFGGEVTVDGYTDAEGKLIEIDTTVLVETGHILGDLVVTKESTCSKVGRGYRVCEDCKVTVDADPATTDELKMKDHDLKLIKGYDATCTVAGRKDYYECYRCGYSQNSDNSYTILAEGHKDANADGICDVCGKDLGSPSSKCGCMCHKESGFSQFIYKILRFFWKLFGMNKSCSCGNVHY